MQKSISRIILTDVFSPLTLLIVGVIMLYSPNATLSIQLNTMFVNLGWIFICGALGLIGISLFEHLTKCKQCRLYNEHTLPECIHERLFLRNDRHE